MNNVFGAALLAVAEQQLERQKRMIRFANEVTREVYDGLTEDQRWESALAEDAERASGLLSDSEQ